jgi:hypothetical protein
VTLREAIHAFLEGLGGFVTATEIIDGVVAAGHCDGREVRSTLARMHADGEVTRYQCDDRAGRPFLYALATSATRAAAAKKSAPKKAVKAAAAPPADPRVAELAERVEFLIQRNRRLLDLLGAVHDGADFGFATKLADEVRKVVENDRSERGIEIESNTNQEKVAC